MLRTTSAYSMLILSMSGDKNRTVYSTESDVPRKDPLQGASDRQTILETVDVESRLRRLIHFLLAEIQAKRKGNVS